MDSMKDIAQLRSPSVSMDELIEAAVRQDPRKEIKLSIGLRNFEPSHQEGSNRGCTTLQYKARRPVDSCSTVYYDFVTRQHKTALRAESESSSSLPNCQNNRPWTHCGNSKVATRDLIRNSDKGRCVSTIISTVYHEAILAIDEDGVESEGMSQSSRERLSQACNQLISNNQDDGSRGAFASAEVPKHPRQNSIRQTETDKRHSSHLFRREERMVDEVIEPGCTVEQDGRSLSQGIEWILYGVDEGRDAITKSLSLFRIAFISLGKEEVPDSTLDSLDAASCFTMADDEGVVHTFQAGTSSDRVVFVNGIRNTIAWFCYHLVAGDTTASLIMQNDLDHTASWLSSLRTLNKVTHTFNFRCFALVYNCCIGMYSSRNFSQTSRESSK